MEAQNERQTTIISTKELERRWQAVRDMMHTNKIDYLVMRNDEMYLGGYVKWFTDIPALYNYPFTVIFPADDEMTTIQSGPNPPGEPSPPKWAVRGVKKRLGAPYFPSAHYTGSYDAELAVGVLKEKKNATIGLVGPSYIPMNFYEYLTKNLPGSTFVDITEEVDRIKVIKSAEEIELIKRTAELQDRAIEHLKKAIRPGRKDFEIYTEAHYSVSMQGSERGLVLVGSGPAGAPVPFFVRHYQNRTIREGDQVSVLIEVNGPGGLYTEIARLFSVGQPSQELQDAFGAAVEAEALTVSLLKPGAKPKDIWDANNSFFQEKGYFPERRLYAHGQGYDLVERPLIRYDEPMEIKAGMNITVHPFAANEKVWGHICDNYLITEADAGDCLHKTPKEIIVV